MLKEYANSFKNLRKVLNIIIIAFSFWLAYEIRKSALFWDHNILIMDNIFDLLIPACFCWFIGTNFHKIYASNRFVPLSVQAIRVTKSTGTSMALFLFYLTIMNINTPSRAFMGLFTVIAFSLLLTEHIFIFFITSFFRADGKNNRNVIIMGTDDEIAKLLQSFKENPGWGIKVRGVISINSDPQNKRILFDYLTYKPFHQGTKAFKELINTEVVDYVFFAIPLKLYRRTLHYISYCIERGIPVKVTTDLLNKLDYVRPEVDKMGNVNIFTFNTIETNPYKLLMKESIDKIVALSGIFLVSPILIFTALAIKLSSPGPIFFKQTRVGKNGRPFNIYKFRSMVINAEDLKESLSTQNEITGPAFKMSNDPRITKIGKFIRKTSIDELPQLFNVLIGNMSLVGPRPPLPTEVAQYSNWQRRRLSVKPGITCTWQVSGRSNIDFDQWMKMDLDYIDKWSISNDAKLLAKTVPAVLMQKGAK